MVLYKFSSSRKKEATRKTNITHQSQDLHHKKDFLLNVVGPSSYKICCACVSAHFYAPVTDENAKGFPTV